MDKLLFRNDGFCFLMTASKLIPGMHWLYMGLCAIVHILMVTGKNRALVCSSKVTKFSSNLCLTCKDVCSMSFPVLRAFRYQGCTVLIASLVYQSSPRISNLGLSCFPCKKSKCSLFSLWGLYGRHIPLVQWNDYMCYDHMLQMVVWMSFRKFIWIYKTTPPDSITWSMWHCF